MRCAPSALRRAVLQDALPTIASCDGIAKDTEILVGDDPVVRRQGALLDLREQPAFGRGAAAQLEDATIGFAKIGECLTFTELDVEEPFAASGRGQANRSPFAIVKNMRCFMHDKIVERPVRPEVAHRYVAGRPFAQADRLVGVSVQIGAAARDIL